MNGNDLASVFAVLCVYNVAASSVRGILKTAGLHAHIKRQHNNEQTAPEIAVEAGQEHPQQEMCFSIPHLQALKDQFAGYIDKNRDERASKEEILEYLQKYNPTVTAEQLRKFIARRDQDGDGYVDFIPDYLMEVSSPDYDINTAREWFELEDSNGDGYVSRDELINIAIKVGMSRKDAERTAIGYYMSADRNGDQQLSWEEYKPLFLA